MTININSSSIMKDYMNKIINLFTGLINSKNNIKNLSNYKIISNLKLPKSKSNISKL